MPLDGAAVRRVCRDSTVVEGRQLCRAELERFRKIAAGGEPTIVACTQEAPLFNEVAGEIAGSGTLGFVNIRETAGWSKDAKAAGPKMAALIAAAAEPAPDFAFVSLSSEGVTLLYGRDERVLEAAELLKDHLDITVLIKPPADIAPARVTEYPVVKGSIRAAKGRLGAFELTIDDYAAPQPSSRGALSFGPARNDAKSRCDILIDLTGGTPLFPAAELRDGYLRADPGDPAAVLRAVLKARDLTGTFDKPRYITFTEDLCAHSRSKLVGCRRCLDLCPTGAIAPNGDHVAIDAHICAGCGQCAAACPTGAAAYALPPADALLRKLRALLGGYREAGGRQAVVLFHDGDHGGALIDALARHGDGLPANVLPVQVNEVTQVGLEAVAASFAYGASALRFLIRAKPRHDLAGLAKTVALAEPILAGVGFAGSRVATIEIDDPDALGATLRAMAPMDGAAKPATFSAVGGKRDVIRLALREMHAVAPHPVDVVALPAGAPFGTLEVKVEGCTLCLSCVSACPTGALSDDPERPTLRFAEDACVQCGLCAATCPEKVIGLKPQLDFRSATAMSRIVKQEEPFACISCGKPFGVKSSVERVLAKLEGKHWMFKDSKTRLDVIKMCESCRVTAMAAEQFDPFGAPARPDVRTTDDYLRDREALKREYEEKSKGES
ncbi:MAG: 4Fe-4S dicluster domain-containing protein [Rhizobiales bacterium]|nr:4Fe-4S dicluster domain-containing protein [Hyphomicrobiales bacterium]